MGRIGQDWTETDRNRQKLTETDIKGQKQAETDRKGQKRTDMNKKQTKMDRNRQNDLPGYAKSSQVKSSGAVYKLLTDPV